MSDDLTNLTWLTSINTNTSKVSSPSNPIQEKVLVSTPQMQVKVVVSASKDASNSLAAVSDSPCIGKNSQKLKKVANYKSMKNYRRPSCSYASLIAMALKASPTGCLPVNEIYQFIENKYPFYRTAPEGWKNSIRHNLSMNNNFIKVQRPDKIHSKKGYYWAINPEKRDALDLDIDKSMKKMKAENSCFNHTFRLSSYPNTVLNSYPIVNNIPMPVVPPVTWPYDHTYTIKNSTTNSNAAQRGKMTNEKDSSNVFYFSTQSTNTPSSKYTVKRSPSTATFEPYEWVANECTVQDGNFPQCNDQFINSLPATATLTTTFNGSNELQPSNNTSSLKSNKGENEPTVGQSLEMLLTKLEQDQPPSQMVTPSISELSFQSSSTAIHKMYHQEQPYCYENVSGSSSCCEYFTANNSTSVSSQSLPFYQYDTSY